MNFANPLFLIGALVAGIPIFLHLMKREHARKMEFSSLMFLQRVSRRSIRYQKLRHLLLLLLRVLAFLLIVFAFSRPYRDRAQTAAVPGGISTAHILVLDNSLSMGYQDRWAKARNAAAGIVRGAGRNDKFAVLEFSDRTEARTQLISDKLEANRRIADLELSDQATKYGQALRVAEKFALDAGTGKRVIYLISDFQKNGRTAEDRNFRLGAGIELRAVDLGSDAFSNLAFREVRVEGAGQAQEGGLAISASVENLGNLERRNVRVRLLLDGRSIAERKADIGREASQGIDFLLPELSSGVHSAVLEVEDPYLMRDNRFNLTVEARTKTLVQVVEPGNPDDRRAPGYFLFKALNVDAVSPYQMASASPQNLSIGGRLLIWNSATGAGASVQAKLRAFVQSGGGLAVILPDGAQASDFNRTFGAWLPVRCEEDKRAELTSKRPFENYVLMTDVRIDHPVFLPFSRPNSGSFSGARFFRHAKLAVGTGADVPARFDNGDPALVSITVGKGRVLIFASSADDSSSDFPQQAVYAPFWQQVLRYLENFREHRHWLEVGNILSPRALLADSALRQAKGEIERHASLAILGPQKQRLALAPGAESMVVDAAGFYEIRAMNVNVPVAVNPPLGESDLAHGNAEEMVAGWMSSKPSVFPEEDRPSPDAQARYQRMWVVLLVAAALLLISELVLSNRQRTLGRATPSGEHSRAGEQP